MKTDKVKEVLWRVLADVDDRMEFAGTVWKSKESASKDVQKAINQAAHQLNQMLIEAKARHLSDISRAIGILDGLGFPDEYLNNQRAKLMKALKAEKDNHADQ